jgi:hypothetical protein
VLDFCTYASQFVKTTGCIRSTAGTIVIAGAIAQKPWYGGHTWVFLQYLLGFKKLGWNVLFVDQLEPEMCVDDGGKPCPLESSSTLAYFVNVMQAFDLTDAFALLYDKGHVSIGKSRKEVIEAAAQSAMFLNVMGFLRDPEILDRAQNRVFLDIDPGFGQMWQHLGIETIFRDHHHYVTIGQNIGQPGCDVPTCGIHWITTTQPVQLDHWQPRFTSTPKVFTTIASWRGAYGPMSLDGKTYGLRVHEFRKFASLPTLTTERFEVALDIHSADSADRTLLEKNAWHLINPRTVARTPMQYRAYIQQSGAEFMVAKNMYVETQSGWLSDRSICYLASGKPVLVQDTGLKTLYACNKGLLTFKCLEEAVSGVQQISNDYVSHARAARDMAQEYFDSNKVLSQLLKNVGVN